MKSFIEWLKKEREDLRATHNARITNFRKITYQTINSISAFLGGFFGPDFFQNAADFLLGFNIPKNSLITIAMTLLFWGLGSWCVHQAEVRRHKLKEKTDD